MTLANEINFAEHSSHWRSRGKDRKLGSLLFYVCFAVAVLISYWIQAKSWYFWLSFSGLAQLQHDGKKSFLADSNYRHLAVLDHWQKAERFSFGTTVYMYLFLLQTGQLKLKILSLAALTFLSFSTSLRSEHKSLPHTNSWIFFFFFESPTFSKVSQVLLEPWLWNLSNKSQYFNQLVSCNIVRLFLTSLGLLDKIQDAS